MGTLNPSVTSILGGDTIQSENEVTHTLDEKQRKKSRWDQVSIWNRNLGLFSAH